MSLCFLHGAPFKFNNKVVGLHKGYVYGVAFSPDGNHLVSVGADKRIQLYDGKTGEPTKSIGEGEHKGSIFGVAWEGSSKRFATCSADQTVKVWDVESGECVKSWRFGGENVSVQDHQVGICWPAGRSDGLIISINLNGDLNYLVEGQDEPMRIVQGHNRSITSMGSIGSTLYTGSFDGRVVAWNGETGMSTTVEGQMHTNQVSGFATSGDIVYTVGWDDTLRLIEAPTKIFLGATQKLDAQPNGVAAIGNIVYVCTVKGLAISGGPLEGFKEIKDYTPTAIAASEDFLAVSDDVNSVHVYKTQASKLEEVAVLSKPTAKVTALRFSSDGSKLSAGNSSGKIVVYSTSDWEVLTDRWSAHTARIQSIAWNDAGTHAVSGGLDTHVHVWSLTKPGSRVKMPNAHKDGVYGVAWLDSGRVASAGGDAAVKVWKVEGLQ
jgi:WD40 repeat protein